jgi:hypothetical protein
MPDEIQVRSHPALAPLAVLEAALCASTTALKAAHPGLDGADRYDWTPSCPAVAAAFAAICVTQRLLDALHDYRCAQHATSLEESEDLLLF